MPKNYITNLFTKFWPGNNKEEKKEKQQESESGKLKEELLEYDIKNKLDTETEQIEEKNKLDSLKDNTEEKIKNTLTRDNVADESLNNEKKDLNITTKKTEEEIEKILYENKLDKLKIFLRRYFIENIWKEPELKQESDNSIDIYIASIQLKKNVTSIILDILKSWGFLLDTSSYGSWIKNDNIKIGFSYDYFSFSISPLSSDNETVLKEVKKFFDKFLPYIENFHEYNFDENLVSNILDLDKNDKLILEDDKITVSFNVNNKNQIDTYIFANIMNHLFSNLSSYYFKLSVTFKGLVLSVFDTELWRSFNIVIYNHKWDISITINYSKYNKPTRTFLQNVFKNVLLYTKEYFNKEVNLVEKLKSYWLIVEESNYDWNIENLYEEKWFVWYEDVKEQIFTHVINPWKNKTEYENFVKEKLPNLKNIVPNAVLFYWVPGTWKTTFSSIIWQYLWYPFVYIPVNKIMSKWFWESENILSDILETCGKLAEQKWWVVVMIDEIDEIWTNRDKTSSDASNRILWVLLKKLDWLEKIDNILLIGWTNRNDSLDPALVSRFSQQIEFRLPNKEERKSILKYYLSFLEENEFLDEISEKLEWKSWRDIKKLSEDFARYVMLKGIKWNYTNELKNYLNINN